jgi:hypothetical protein
MVIASRVAILGFGCVLLGAFAVDAQVTSVDFAGRLATSGRFFCNPERRKLRFARPFFARVSSYQLSTSSQLLPMTITLHDGVAQPQWVALHALIPQSSLL